MQVLHEFFSIMPSQRKRIGFLPSKEVQEIIDKICRENNYSQSKVTGMLVEEALRIRSSINKPLFDLYNEKKTKTTGSIKEVQLKNNDNTRDFIDLDIKTRIDYIDNLKMINEFIEFKLFKKIMKQNKEVME